ncbi:MAG: hypothetical protein M4579_004619, partial [Chaenotheca gracillima]
IELQISGVDDVEYGLRRPVINSLTSLAERSSGSTPTLAMPDKPLTVATYAAGASLAAIALVFVFGPTFCIDGEESGASRRARKKGVVGLFNPANDCFINAVLQSLAGLGDLRTYLIRECHRRSLDHELYETVDPSTPTTVDQAKLLGLQKGIVGAALKEVLDRLNERPIYKKTISASDFVRILENGFRQRLSRQQQDAQEFLQVVAERLSDEYHAGRRVRERARQDETFSGEKTAIETSDIEKGPPLTNTVDDGQGPTTEKQDAAPKEDEEGFPLEGKLSSQIECQKCHFKPKPRISTFVTLTLNVPHDSSSTTLSHCFDVLLKTEYIDDFKCDKCRLTHALAAAQHQLGRSTSTSTPSASEVTQQITALEKALVTDPEHPPKELPLPPLSSAPTSRIARHVAIISFPKIIAIHLSRSMYSMGSSSTKNSAKVSFPERLPLGGLLNQQRYKLLGMVTHKGSHNSGHYESFRRQNIYPPFSTPDAFKPGGAYSANSRSPVQSPEIPPNSAEKAADAAARSSNSDLPSLTDGPSSSSSATSLTPPNPLPKTIITPPPSSSETTPDPSSLSPALSPQPSPKKPNESLLRSPSLSTPSVQPRPSSVRLTKKRKSDRWWRISDEKIKEARTSEVLGMQREVYLLFYELDKEEP